MSCKSTLTMNIYRIGSIVLIIFAVISIARISTSDPNWQSDHYSEERGFYNNDNIDLTISPSRLMSISKRYFFDDYPNTEPFGLIPIQPLTLAELQAETRDAIYRLGHSSILMKLSGKYVLTDPVFSERASPVQWYGPKRFHPVPIDINTLPTIAVVVISHDHYDHLDKNSIKLLADKTQNFVVPLGVAKHLINWGIEPSRIYEMDWWQSVRLADITFTSTPSQHFSGRGLFDRNTTLWSSWVIVSPAQRIFFSGDSGYFDGFKTIGEKFGPFDLTILENGAYNKEWTQSHMLPAETVQAHIDLKGKAMLPVHNCTFNLAFHPWNEPLEKVSQLADEKNILVQTPVMGQAAILAASQSSEKWWRNIVDAE